MKHTPGPWKLQYPRIIEASGDVVFDLRVGSQEDAKLATASPQLLATLKALRVHLADMDRSGSDHSEEIRLISATIELAES